MSRITIPTFSLAELKQGLHHEALRACATEMGVLYLTDYGVSDEDHRQTREAAMQIFEHATPEEKQALTTKISNIRRGFSGLEAESTALVTNTGEYSDYSMCYSMGTSDNIFPTPAFEATWTDYFDRLYAVAQDTARVILNSTGTYDGRDMDELLDGDPMLRLRYFPEVPADRVAEQVPLRMAPHYDLSIVTLIHQTPCANGFVSLQAEVGGEMVDLPSVPGTIVVLCGAVATIASQGAVPAPKHHVAAPPAHLQAGSGRTSSVFFLRPRASFTFSVPAARSYGLNVIVTGETATFGDWMGINYEELHTRPEAQTT